MQASDKSEVDTLTGRIAALPSQILEEDVLAPQFHYEARHLLHWYLLIEKVQTLEYEHLGVISRNDVRQISTLLDQINEDTLKGFMHTSMTDILFAIEKYVEAGLPVIVPGWHVDRSRNDIQACAQTLFVREQLFEIATALLDLAEVCRSVCTRVLELPMPGYTHYQVAQVVSPGFYLSALLEEILKALHGLLSLYERMNVCPLGAGALSGLELPWDRSRMAQLLGFIGVERHALVSVASRGWGLHVALECSALATVLSRFVTDLMTWGGSGHQFIDLPDELSGISSAMPQKKNFPVLERIRGKTSHVIAFAIDMAMGQRNTPYSNLVEVSKEANSHFLTLCKTLKSTVRLLGLVLANIRFDEKRLRDACEQEFLGGFSLANDLCLGDCIPFRTAQVIAGRYITTILERQHLPEQYDLALLQSLCLQYGYATTYSEEHLAALWQATYGLHAKQTAGSTHPDAMKALLEQQRHDLVWLREEWFQRIKHIETMVLQVKDRTSAAAQG